MKKGYYWGLGLGVVCVLISPWLFVRPALCDALNFSGTGQIGDTIGGITAPIVGLVSITLLFLTLKAQLAFNTAQVQENAVSQILALQAEILHADSKIEFTYQLNDKQSTSKDNYGIGCLSLQLLHENNDDSTYLTLKQASFLLTQLKIFLSLCECYRSLLTSKQKALNIDQSYIEFVEGYENIITKFLKGIVDGTVHVRAGVMDAYSTDDMESEIDSLKNQAREMICIFPVQP